MAVGVKAPAEVVRTGWLDRVVAYSKQKFIEDVQSVLPPIEFKVQLAKAPPGYVDSKEWDYDSVMRLLTLLRQSEQAKPVARALRRMMGKPDIVQNNTRRIFMSKQESYKFFPKLGSNVYYEDSYEQDMGPMPDLEGGNFMPGDYSSDAIVIISNPVESRLPSSHISVGMLKEILETRAMAARVMPTYEVPTIYWAPMNTTTDAVENVTGASQENATTTGGDAAAGGDDASSGNDSNGSNSSDPVPG
ncbi:uncharacterized protein LOC126379068, partial [Pectinophora gossypiella]|uniref:uncharacterized protein LOC126379068 n=1 Tax=Pectinophora gossypiella TaxID=13191 RepID=UPI00214E32E1